MATQRNVHKPLLFEIAWEVANKVGGIYTVLKSKAPVTCHEYGDRYTMIGPLSYKTAPLEVETLEPDTPELRLTLESMKERGVKFLYGRWLIEGAPKVLLFDTGSVYHKLDEWKGDLWNVTGIPSPPNDHETNEAILFGYLVAWFLGEFVAHEKRAAIIAHFHEWLAGVGIALCRKRHIDVTTIFTTHATLLGRYLCAGSVDFYNNLRNFDVDHEAGKRGIYHRYCIERAATHCCDVFTTVSHITAYEAEHLLKRKPGLNEKLKACNSPMTVVAFIITPAETHSFTVETLKGQAVVKQLKETVHDIAKRMETRLFEKASRGGDVNTTQFLTSEDQILLKRRTFALKRSTLPPIVTHNMADDDKDPVLNQLRRLGLFNHPSDRVKIVFHPEFLNSSNPLFGLDYEEFVRGCHLGVFPSYYEPWGYTPAECTVMGVPSITTNLSGFGCFMDDNIVDSSEYGIYIVDRRMKSVEESIQQLADQMLMFCQKSRRQRINQRNRTERLSDLLDWKRMGLEYIKARQLALRRAYSDSFDDDYFGLDEATQQQLQLQEQRTKIPNPRSAPGSPRIRTPLEGVDTELTFAKMSAHDRERYLSYKMQGHDDDEALMDDVTAMQIKIPFRQRQSTHEERLAEGDFDVSEAEVEAAQGDIAQVGHAAATQKQYKDPVGGAKNGQYYQPGAASVGGHNGSYNNGNGYHR
ncbi:glycogen synthase [Linnemannia elongata AG-77]|uniref:Glycogen [starch] synthase n=1 Tax=Linnemannia elongata AG-77 TaxID=1314771 RepID=A0A197JCA4_9FUNG|nr:glycogen synthase [Linnemannia elongata AG-77]